MAGKSSNRGVQYGAELLTTIKEIREEHHACTMRELARRLRQTHTVIGRQLKQLFKWGFVSWTKMEGSLVVTSKGGLFRKGVLEGRITEYPRSVDDESLPSPEQSMLVGPKDEIGSGALSRRI